MKSRAPLIVAIALLLLPVLYVASYLALVITPSTFVGGTVHYRWGSQGPEAIFWPLEQIDRKVRPGAWHDGPGRIGIDFEPVPRVIAPEPAAGSDPGVVSVEHVQPGEPAIIPEPRSHLVLRISRPRDGTLALDLPQSLLQICPGKTAGRNQTRHSRRWQGYHGVTRYTRKAGNMATVHRDYRYSQLRNAEVKKFNLLGGFSVAA